ncbi:MAG: DUF494 family protein [bacterium]|nr:MAG: DUF494 family protein [bacterium]
MTDRIKEIIAILMDPESGALRDPATLYGELEDMGYTHEEINRALDMLDFDSSPEDHTSDSLNRARNRILGELEKSLLSIPAQGYLLSMLRMGYISETQLSVILDNASLEYSPPLSLFEIKEIASRYIPDLPEYDPSHSTRRSGPLH